MSVPKNDRTQLTEALEWFDDPAGMPDANPLSVLAEAARLLLDFPTDEQVEAASNLVAHIANVEVFPSTFQDAVEIAPWIRAVLEAVRL